jgi:hypothetical protein
MATAHAGAPLDCLRLSAILVWAIPFSALFGTEVDVSRHLFTEGILAPNCHISLQDHCTQIVPKIRQWCHFGPSRLVKNQ